MKTRVRAFLFIFSTLVLSAGGAVVVALFYPAVPLRLAVPWAARHGWHLRFDSARGTPASDYRLTHLSVEGPGIRFQARSLTLDLRWTALLRKRFVVDALRFEAPSLWVDPRALRSAPSAPPGGKPASPARPFTLSEVRIEGGSVTVAGLPEKFPSTVTNVDAVLSLNEGRLRVSSLTLRSGNDVLSARGAFDPGALRWNAAVDLSGDVSGHGDFKGSTAGWTLDGRAVRRKGVPRLGAVSGWVSARGSGMTLEGLRTVARLEMTSQTGLRSEMTLTAKDGRIRWDGKVVADALSARTNGDVLLKTKSFHVRLRGENRSKDTPWTADVSLDGTSLSHRFTVALSGAEGSVAARGRGRIAGRRWDASWAGLEARWREVSQTAGPFQTTFSPGSLSVTGLSLLQEKGSLRMDGVFRPGDFRLRLKAAGFNVGPLLENLLTAKIKDALLDADISLSRRGGFLGATGDLRLVAAEARLPFLDMDLHPLSIVLKGEGRRLLVREGKGVAKKGGLISFTGAVTPSGPDITVRGKKLPFRFADVAGVADADLAFAGSWGRPVLRGDIFLRKADFEPPKKPFFSKRKKKKVPEAPAPDAQPAPSPLALDLSLRADHNVWYKQQDTAVELKTDMKVEREPYGPLRLYGSVETVRGDYFFYGRRFVIQNASLLFAGETPINPSLSIQALHQAGDIDVTLTVSGTLQRPEVGLTSNPALDETDILSVLATGHPVEDVRSAGGNDGRATEAAAQGLVAGYLSGKVQERLQRRVPLDVLRLNVQGPGSAALTVGKNITERLYVALEQTLGSEGESRVRSEYILTRWLGLEGSSTGQGKYVLDLLFKFGFK